MLPLHGPHHLGGRRPWLGPLGAAFAGSAGGFAAWYYGPVDFHMGAAIGLKALTAAIVGLGIAVLTSVTSGTKTVTKAVSTHLNGTTVTTTF